MEPHWPLQDADEEMDLCNGRYNEGPEVLRQERIAKIKELKFVPEQARPHTLVAFPEVNHLAKDTIG